jgi:hypothetical protein
LEEKEAKVACDLEEQEDVEGKEEAGSADEDSDSDYSSADEKVLTQAGGRSAGCWKWDRKWAVGTFTCSNPGSSARVLAISLLFYPLSSQVLCWDVLLCRQLPLSPAVAPHSC